MSGVRTLVVYATKHDITTRIAATIVKALSHAGLDAVLSDSTPRRRGE